MLQELTKGPVLLTDYKPVSVLGYGKFSTVIKVELQHEEYAVKIITKSDSINKINKILSISNKITNYDNEVRIIKKLSEYKHQNIVQYYAIYNSVSSIYIVQEISPFGEMTPSNFKYQQLSDSSIHQSIETVIKNRIIDMVSAIYFLHSLKIIHRDIKPSNFLLFNNGKVKLTDFDTCYTLTSNAKDDRMSLYSKLIGTPLFLPPELLTQANHNFNNSNNSTSSIASSSSTSASSKLSNFTKKLRIFEKSPKFDPYPLDMWSLGATLYYLFYSSYPFYADNEFTLLHRIATQEPKFPEFQDLSFKIDPDFKIVTIIENLLIKDPTKRFKVNDVLKTLNLAFPPSYEQSKSRIGVFVVDTGDCELDIPNEIVPSDSFNHPTEIIGNMEDFETASNQFKFQLPIFMAKPQKPYSKSTSSLPLKQLVTHKKIDSGTGTEEYKRMSTYTMPNPVISGDSMLPSPTQLRSIAGSQSSNSSLKHSGKMNFKKFRQKNEDAENDQMGKDYRLYTMEDYFDRL